MSDEEDELRRMLAARADRVHSTLSGPAIRARAQARRPLRRYAPLLSAAAVLAVLVIGFVLLQRGPSSPDPVQVPPAATVTSTTTTEPRPTTVTTSPASTPESTTTRSQASTSPVGTTGTTTSH